MNFIISTFLGQWRLLAIAAVALWGALGWWNYTGLKAVRAAERQAAAEFAAKAEKEAREKDNKNAALAAQLEAEHLARLADIDAGRDDFDKRLRAARSARCNIVPAATAASGQPPQTAAGGDRPNRTDDPGHNLRIVGLKLQADVLECWTWALSVGR